MLRKTVASALSIGVKSLLLATLAVSSEAKVSRDMTVYLRDNVQVGADRLRSDLLASYPLGSATDETIRYLTESGFHCELISPTHLEIFRNRYFCFREFSRLALPATATILLAHSDGKTTDIEVGLRWGK